MSEQKQKDTLVYNYIKACYPEAAEVFRKAAKLEVSANVAGQLAFVIGSILVHGTKRPLSPMRNGPGPKKSKTDSATVQAVLTNLAGKQMKTSKTNIPTNTNQSGIPKESSSSDSDDSDDAKKPKVNATPVIRSPVKSPIKSPVKMTPTPVSVAKKADSSESSDDSEEESAPKKVVAKPTVATAKSTPAKLTPSAAAKKADSDSDDSDSSEDTPPKKVASPVKPPIKPATASKAKAESSDDSDSDDSDDDAKKPKPNVGKKPVVGKGAKNTPKSVSESSEKIANNDSDSDDSDDSDEDTKKPTKPAAVVAKATPKPAPKKKESSDDSDDSSEDEKPKTKKPAPLSKTPTQTKPTPKATPAKQDDSDSSDDDDDDDDDDDEAAKKPKKANEATKATPSKKADDSSSDSSDEDEEPKKKVSKTPVTASKTFTPKSQFKSKGDDSPQGFTPNNNNKPRKSSPFRRVKTDGSSGFTGGDFKITGKTPDPFTNLKGKEFKKEKTKKKKGFNKPM